MQIKQRTVWGSDWEPNTSYNLLLLLWIRNSVCLSELLDWEWLHFCAVVSSHHRCLYSFLSVVFVAVALQSSVLDDRKYETSDDRCSSIRAVKCTSIGLRNHCDRCWKALNMISHCMDQIAMWRTCRNQIALWRTCRIIPFLSRMCQFLLHYVVWRYPLNALFTCSVCVRRQCTVCLLICMIPYFENKCQWFDGRSHQSRKC